MDDGHGRIKMKEVEQYIDDTWFAWIVGSEDNSVYYYWIHSPVILIEFDHQKPVGTRERTNYKQNTGATLKIYFHEGHRTTIITKWVEYFLIKVLEPN